MRDARAADGGGAGRDGTPAASRAGTSIVAVRRAIGGRESVSLVGSWALGERGEVLAATYPAVTMRDEGSRACRVLKISVAREACSADGEEIRARPAAWRRESGGLDLCRQ